METKVYFFARHSKREFYSRRPRDSQRSQIQALVHPKLPKPVFISSISPIATSPYNIRKPASVSPLFKQALPHPRSRSYKLVNPPKKSVLEKQKTSIIPKKLNMRYLKQDFDDVEVLNVIKTPEESRKNSLAKLSTDWIIPSFDEVFANIRVESCPRKQSSIDDVFNTQQKGFGDVFESLKGKNGRIRSKNFDFANQNTSEE